MRRGGKVVQETVAQLGPLDARGRARARALAERICAVRERQKSFFEEDVTTEPHPARVRIDKLRVERQRRFGDVWLGLKLWQALGLDAVCEEVLPSGRETVPWSLVAAISVIARLCEPSSELYVADSSAWLGSSGNSAAKNTLASMVSIALRGRALTALPALGHRQGGSPPALHPV